MATRRQQRQRRIAWTIGLVCVLLVVALQPTSAVHWLENATLNLRFRYTNSIPDSGQIVCIGIDDSSLETVGRWPWPRFRQAALISVAAELNARAILVDLTLDDPEPMALNFEPGSMLRLDPTDARSYDQRPVPSDLELAAAIREAGNVHLGFLFRPGRPLFSPHFWGAHGLCAAVSRGEDPAVQSKSLDALRSIVERSARHDETPGLAGASLADLARLTVAWSRQLDLLQPEFAGETDYPADAAFWPHVQHAAWLFALEQSAVEEPELVARPLHRVAGRLFPRLTRLRIDRRTPQREWAQLTMDQWLGLHATWSASALERPEAVASAAVEVGQILPVEYALARVAAGCGFTVFEPDAIDGVTRRMSAFVRHGDRVKAQLALGLAIDTLGAQPGLESLVGWGRWLEIGAARLQLDENGAVIIPWLAETDWPQQFTHVPADKVMEVHSQRASIRDNMATLFATARSVLAPFHEGPVAAAWLARVEVLPDKYEQRDRARWAGRLDDAGRWSAEITADEAFIAANFTAVFEEARAAIAELEQRHGGEGDEAQQERRRLAGYRRGIEAVEALRSEVLDGNARLQANVDSTLAQLGPLLDDRIVLIGYTASALADMKPTPVAASVPGVMAHASLLNGVLVNRTISWTPAWLSVVLTVVVGFAASGATVTLRNALPIIALLLVSYSALAVVAPFYWFGLWVPAAAPLLAAVLSHFAIATYRFIFVDRERRQLATALGQYTSREIARVVAEDIDLCRRAEARDVTSMFTDLKGFTTISERIGAERTQALLNICLGRFTEVIQRRSGMVNKFLGDGVFAFWNPVILPQARHAALAAEAALDLQAALDALKREQLAAGGDAVFADIFMRVGLATGRAVVGPCGSEQKFDYTCIGDCVNLAARLESANKYYGTKILLSEPTCAELGVGFELRALGAVQVVGKREGVRIFELLGRVGEVDDDTRAHARAFESAVEAFTQRRWTDAAEVFGACIERRADDLAAMRYAELCARYHRRPPDDDWSGAIELEAK